jgi:hypothetical protein
VQYIPIYIYHTYYVILLLLAYLYHHIIILYSPEISIIDSAVSTIIDIYV